MRAVTLFAFVSLCLMAAAPPAWSQAPSENERMSYVEEKPQMSMALLQQLFRRMRGGEGTIVEPPKRNNPTPAHWTYAGPNFSGHYWEERIGDREAISILGVWISGFHNSCDGRYLITSKAPFEIRGDLVHSGTWACEMKDMTINGYFTVHKFGETVHIFFTLPEGLDTKPAQGIAEQIHTTLVAIMRSP
jgi:hypothetical protein